MVPACELRVYSLCMVQCYPLAWRIGNSNVSLTEYTDEPITNHRLSYSYWTMHFDTSPRTLRSLNSIMRSDPRVIRWTMLKLGEKIEDVVKHPEKTVDRSGEAATGRDDLSQWLGARPRASGWGVDSL
jgi:hypothetical protein